MKRGGVMGRKTFLVFSAVLFLSVFNAEAYFFSLTNGTDLMLVVAKPNASGKLVVTSEFKYAAPGVIGVTALLPASGTTATRRVFDLFATFVDAQGNPAVVRDRLEFDETTRTWTHVSRKLFPTHKLDSFVSFSASVSPNGSQRFLLTENGPNVNRRKVNAAGNLTGGNKAVFKNPSQLDPLSAALSPNGDYAVQSSFVNTGAASVAENGKALLFGLHLFRFANRQQVNFGLANEIINTAIAFAEDFLCFAFREGERDPSGAGPATNSAANKSGVFYITFDPTTLQPIGNPVQISKKAGTPLFQQEIFNTTLLLPDGKGIVFAKHKNGKLEYRVQPLNGGCGPKLGKPYKLLSRTNPTIANNNPLYGWAAAPCASGALAGIC